MGGDARASAVALPAWADELFSQPLIAVDDAAGRPTPVWAIAGALSDARVSEQFTANAGAYHARYAASGHFEGLFRQALEATRIAVAEAPLILDLGSGSGANSVVPCVSLFPGARQIATDLSADLLAIPRCAFWLNPRSEPPLRAGSAPSASPDGAARVRLMGAAPLQGGGGPP